MIPLILFGSAILLFIVSTWFMVKAIMDNDYSPLLGFVFLFLTIMAAFSGAVVEGFHSDHQFNQKCQALGGHKKDIGSGTFCLSSDGRILDS